MDYSKDTNQDENHEEGDRSGGEYGGVGRLGFFVGYITCSVLLYFLLQPNKFGERIAAPYLVPPLLFFFLVLVYARLVNVGKVGLNLVVVGLLSLVPPLSIWPILLCFAAQAGYEQTGELDSKGRIINLVVWIWLLMLIAVVLIAFFSLR